jgi:hypothetical protein
MCMKSASAFAGAVLLACSAFTAQALPAVPFQAIHEGTDVTLVADGCGVGRRRGPEGHCHREGEEIVVEPVAPVVGPIIVEPGRVCPPGMHLGPHRRECIR